MKKLLLSVCIFASVSTFISCKKTELTAPAAKTDQETRNPGDVIFGKVTPGDCTPTEVTLIAGQTINSGTVTVSNDANYIYVTYTTTNGWTLMETHLYVGDCALIPVSGGGNPVPGQFPYSSSHSNATTYTYTVPISTIPAGGCGCIAAHAVVKNAGGGTETAWGQGTRINPRGGAWGMKFNYCSCTPE